MRSTDELAHHLGRLGRVLLGYSGGIDSTLLAVVGRRALGRDRFLAALGVSPSLGEVQRRRAVSLATEFDLPLVEIVTDELADPSYRANDLDRCYHCKRTLWRQLGAFGRDNGWESLVDGTNADDLDEHRAGARAGDEAAVHTPLADLGWSKADVRAASRALGIPGWDAPASPCLASRLRPHLTVTPERLAQVEAAEQLLRSVGVTGDLRVRHHDDLARIEVQPAMFALVDGALERIADRFSDLGFRRIERDPDGYRRGSLTVLAG